VARPPFVRGWPLSYDESIDVSLASPFVRYALLSAAIVLVTAAVPGVPFYADEGPGAIDGAIIVTGLVLAALLTRARLSWYIAAALDGVGLAWFGALVLLEIPHGVSVLKPLALTALAALQIGVLFSQGFDDWLRRRTVAPA
jgi:hypothetical protein